MRFQARFFVAGVTSPELVSIGFACRFAIHLSIWGGDAGGPSTAAPTGVRLVAQRSRRAKTLTGAVEIGEEDEISFEAVGVCQWRVGGARMAGWGRRRQPS